METLSNLLGCLLLWLLTVACMKRWGLRASYLSTDTNADAGQNVRLTT
jgi:hypothetical protein